MKIMKKICLKIRIYVNKKECNARINNCYFLQENNDYFASCELFHIRLKKIEEKPDYWGNRRIRFFRCKKCLKIFKKGK